MLQVTAICPQCDTPNTYLLEKLSAVIEAPCVNPRCFMRLKWNAQTKSFTFQRNEALKLILDYHAKLREGLK